jgi:hypothetical protein
MRTQLALLRKLVAEELRPDAVTISAQETEQWIQAMPRIQENIFIALRNEVFGDASDRLLERHFQQMQMECIELLDCFQQYTHIQSDALRQTLTTTLFGILSYLEKHHTQYYNMNAGIPQAYFKSAVDELHKQTQLLSAAFKKHKLNETLAGILYKEVEEFKCRSGCSYAELVYLKALVASLLGLCREQDASIYPRAEQEAQFNAAVEEHLLYMRFNHPAIIKYLQHKIAGQASQLFNLREQFELLCGYEKKLKTQQERVGLAYEPAGYGSVKDVLLLYVKAELKFLHKMMCCYDLSQAGNSGQAANLSKRLERPAYRIKTTLSVDAFAYLIRLLVEAGAIDGAPKRELLRFLSEHVETPRSGVGPISLDSLINKYKQVVQRSADAIRTLLKRMLKLLEESFGTYNA